MPMALRFGPVWVASVIDAVTGETVEGVCRNYVEQSTGTDTFGDHIVSRRATVYHPESGHLVEGFVLAGPTAFTRVSTN